jgi:hypothetical protein
MARGAASQADLLLIAELAARGLDVSPYQLERWRAWGQLPKPTRHGCGRGGGSVSEYPQEAAEIAAVLATCGGQGRSRHVSTLVMFCLELPVAEWAVREALAKEIEDDLRRTRQLAQRHEFYVADRATRAARAVDVDFPLLLGTTSIAGATRAQQRERARQRKQLKRYYAARVHLQYGGVSSHDLEEDLAPLGPLAGLVVDMVRDDEHAADGSTLAFGDPGWRALAMESDFQRLCVARGVLTRLARANGLLHVMARYWDEPREILHHLASVPIWSDLAALPSALANPIDFPARFAELVLTFATLEIQLLMAAFEVWFLDTAIGPAARGLELVAEYAEAHDTPMREMPSYEQLGMIGHLDFKKNGDPSRATEHDSDLVAMLSSNFGIELSPRMEPMVRQWGAELAGYLIADENSDTRPTRGR